VCGTDNGISVGGNNNVISGLAFSNGSMSIARSVVRVDNAIYGGPHDCSLDDPGNRAATHSTHSDESPWPKTWVRNIVCAEAEPKNNVPGPMTLVNPADGVYCSDTSITVTRLRDSRITLVAPTLDVPVNNVSLSAFFDGLLFWQSSGDFTFGPNNSNVDGWIWVPGGTLTVSGNSVNRGFYEAFDVKIAGNNFDLSGNGPIGPTVTQTVPVTTSTTPATTVPGTVVTLTNQTTRTVGTTLGLDE